MHCIRFFSPLLSTREHIVPIEEMIYKFIPQLVEPHFKETHFKTTSTNGLLFLIASIVALSSSLISIGLPKIISHSSSGDPSSLAHGRNK